MVKKSSKRGLNTGNTIRRKPDVSGSIAYDYIAVREDAEFGLHDSYESRYEQLSQVIPVARNDGVEYSLSKKKRWELIPHLRELAEPEEGNTEQKVNLYIHQARTDHPTCSALGLRPDAPTRGHTHTVLEFQTNLGPVKSKVSQRQMQMRTVDQPHTDIDHFSKRERRKLGRKRLSEMKEERKQEMESHLKDVTSTLNCHVVQRAPRNGFLFRDRKAYNNYGWDGLNGIRQKHRAGKAVDVEDYCLEDLEKEFNEDEGDFVVAPRSETATIADYLDRRLQACKSTRGSTSSNESTDSGCSFKGNLQYISRQSSRCEEVVAPEEVTENLTSQFSPAPAFMKLDFNEDDVSIGMLKALFGEDYEESYCYPRVFNIKLTSRQYLICQQNGSESSVYRVHISGDSELDISTFLPVSSLQELVATIRANLSGGTENEELVRNSKCTIKSRAYLDTMKTWHITTQQFDEFTEEILKEQIRQTEQKILDRQVEDGYVMVADGLQRSNSVNLYCGVCFDELDPSAATETPYISLLPCNHIFCINCWSTHIQSQLAQATANIRCAEFDCNSEVDPVLVRSLVGYQLFQRFIERKAELLLQTDDATIFCPSERCNKVIGMKGSLVNKEPVTVYCECGAAACLVCQNKPHWPIPCDLVHKYTDSLKKDGLYKSTADFGKSYSVVVNYKPCPQCKLPIEKDGGCVHMHCTKCLTSFCWTCLVPYTGTQYYHECPQKAVVGKQAEFTSTSPSMGKHYAQAVRQRCHIGGENEKRSFHAVLKKLKPFLATVNMRQSLKHAEEGEIGTLTNKLKHVAIYCHGARRLLENCAALNHIRRGRCVLCPHKLLLLELYLDTIDHLTDLKCSSKALESIFETYTKAKQTSDVIIAMFSDALYGQ